MRETRLVGRWKKADVKKKQKGRSEEDKLAQQGRKELLNRQLREQKGCEKEKGRKQSRRLREAEDRSEWDKLTRAETKRAHEQTTQRLRRLVREVTKTCEG